MSFRVVVTDEAKRNVRSIRDWIQERSPDGAKRWLDAFENATQQLANNPHGRSLAPEDPHSSRELRNILFKTRRGRIYRAIFYVEDDMVTITHVRGPGQQLLPPQAFSDN